MGSDYSLLITAFSSAMVAQIIKFLFAFRNTKQLQLVRLLEPGGMPSSHTAIVVSLMIGILLRTGMHSDAFAVSAVLASVVIYDAMNIRRSAGEHAKLLNLIIQASQKGKPMTYLKEKLGHTPIEVAAGAVLGVGVAVLVHVIYNV